MAEDLVVEPEEPPPERRHSIEEEYDRRRYINYIKLLHTYSILDFPEVPDFSQIPTKTLQFISYNSRVVLDCIESKHRDVLKEQITLRIAMVCIQLHKNKIEYDIILK